MRFFRQHGRSEGRVAAHLPGEKSDDGKDWYFLEHDDGDQEESGLESTAKAVGLHADGVTDPEEEDWLGEEFDPNELEEEFGEEDEEEFEEEDEEEDRASRLWPSQDVRLRWLNCLQASKTVAEVALALSAFKDHAQAFDSLGPDPLDSLGENSAGLWGRPSRGQSKKTTEATSAGSRQNGQRARGAGRGLGSGKTSARR